MNKQSLKIAITFVLAAVVFVSSCKKDDPDIVCDGATPTYNSAIKAIIDNNCTDSACHGTGSSLGDFTSYAGLEPVLNNGRFTEEVLTEQTMPQGGSLNTEQLTSIQCWVDNGFPEQ